MSMFLHVIDAEYIEDHSIRLSFSDGTSAEIDLAKELNGSVFEPLEDVVYFQQFKLVGHTLAWDNGADFAPEFLKGLAEKQGTLLSRTG